MIALPTAIPWRLIGIVAAAALLVWAGIWITGRIRVSYQAELERDQAREQHAAYKANVEQQTARTTLQQARDQEADARHAGEVDALKSELDELRAARARQKPTTETTDAKGTTRVAINGPWWLCVSTAVSRDAADRAACQASAGDASLPYPVSR